MLWAEQLPLLFDSSLLGTKANHHARQDHLDRLEPATPNHNMILHDPTTSHGTIKWPESTESHTHTHPQSFTSQKSHHSHHKDLCSQNRMISKRSLSHCWALAPVQLLSQRPYLSQSANVTLRCVKITY